MIIGRVLAMLFVSSVVSAQPAGFRQLLDSIRAQYKLPAVGAVVFTADSIIALEVVGFRRAGDPTPAARNDRFHIGSDTKAMTAGLLGLLVDRGRLRWESTLAELFPHLVPSMRAEYRDLTVRELLTHQSGVRANPGREFNEGTPRRQREAFMRWIVTQPLATARGQGSYANSNYIIAGAIAERLYGDEFETLLVSELLRPLGITTAGFGAPGSPDRVDQPWPHRTRMLLGGMVPVTPGPGADNPPVFSPAGRLHISLGDWAKWGQAVMRGARGEKSPWSPATAKALVTPVPGGSGPVGYSFGWGVVCRSWARPTGRALSHHGSNTMNYATAWLAPDADFGVFIATNIAHANAHKAMDDVASGALRLFLLSSRDSSGRSSGPRAPSPCSPSSR